MAIPNSPPEEAAPNVETRYRASKRKSRAFAKGKENISIRYDLERKRELCHLLKERGLSPTGYKADLVRKLQEDDTKEPYKHVNAFKEGNTDGQSAADEFDFVTICRPASDIGDEKSPNSEFYNPKEDVEENRAPCGADACICGKPASERPGWKWLLSKKGYETMLRLEKEAQNRDQNRKEGYFVNRHNGLGFQEVLENQLLSFDWEFRRKEASPAVLWQHIEGFAFILPHDDWPFGLGFTAPDFPDIFMLIGGAVMCTIDILKKNNLLHAGSTIKNIALVLRKFHQLKDELSTLGEPLPEDFGLDERGFSWQTLAIEEAQRHGIEFEEVLYSTESKTKDSQLDSQEPKVDDQFSNISSFYFGRIQGEDINWNDFQWTRHFNTYCLKKSPHNGCIGGRRFVIKSLEKRKKVESEHLSLPPSPTW